MKTVILAAGFGSRLWPLSTSEKPKQFQPLINDISLVRYTYDLLQQAIPTEDLYVLTLAGLEQHVYNELPEIAHDHVLLVPERRNTLPHTIWAVNELSADSDEPILFKSVDHYVVNPKEFVNSLRSCVEQLEKQSLKELVLLCSKEVYSANNGYALVDKDMHVLEFKEKPSKAYFEALEARGAVYRSPFVYVCSQSVLRATFEEIKTPLAQQALRLLAAPADKRREVFLSLPVVDISSNLFQITKRMQVAVIAYDFIDVGLFSNLYDLGTKDANGNVISGNVILGDACSDNYIVNQTERPLVVGNARAMVVAQTDAGSVVMPMAHASAVGELYKSKIHKH